MGTQQMFLVIMSVIIVGILIVVGITLFNSQAYAANKRSLASEMTTYPPLVFKYWNTSVLLGGAGQLSVNLTKERLAGYIGFSDSNYSLKGENGEFRITSVTGRSIIIKGLGRETRGTNHPLITTSIVLDTKQVTTTVSDAAGL